MSNQTTSTPSANLFARKGAARPVGPGTFEDQAKNDNQEIAPVSDKSAADDPNTAASLFSIDFKRRTATDRAMLAAIDVVAETEEAPAEAQPPTSAAEAPARPVPAGQRTPASLILVLLVSVCIGVGIWYVLQQQRLTEDRQVSAASPASPASSEPASSASAAPAAESAPGAQGDGAQAKTSSDSDPSGTAGPDAASVVPSFDLIRIEPDGEAVIAGRAPPDSELILLDNGKPIGTVTADWAGEWAFIPEKPLAPGKHEFSLVIMTPQGTVTVPAVTKPDKGAALVPPAPAKAGAGLKRGDYVIQLSSTTTMKGAKQELSKLQRNFAGLLGSKKLSVHQAKLDQGSVRYRVRSDALAGREAARKLCAAFRAQRQECLVVKR